MFNHEPPGCHCPFCALLRGAGNTRPAQDDIVARRERATVLIASVWWPRNPGHVLVVPDVHYENLYDLPGEYAYPAALIRRSGAGSVLQGGVSPAVCRHPGVASAHGHSRPPLPGA